MPRRTLYLFLKQQVQCRSLRLLIALFITLLLILTTQSTLAQTFTTIYSFQGKPDGVSSSAGVIADRSGNLYGTNYRGGASSRCTGGCGAIFKIDTTGNETLLFSFNRNDGETPISALVPGDGGNLYGTTTQGGDPSCFIFLTGCGTVFQLNIHGGVRVLHKFAGAPDDAGIPFATLIRDSSGTLYGTTHNGGTFDQGTVFQVDANGLETVLYNFKGAPDGSSPYGGVVRDEAGNLFGTTQYGGASNSGTVFKLDPSGNETLLYNFSGGLDGANPATDLLFDGKSFYGTTPSGGADAYGTVFRLDRDHTLTVLYSFVRDGKDGGNPYAGLTRDAAGNLYGTTFKGGMKDYGTVFKLDPNGVETVLHSFSGMPDGKGPRCRLLLDPSGNLVGTTSEGGAFNQGMVFRIQLN